MNQWKMPLTPEEFYKLENFNNYKIEEIIKIFGFFIDASSNEGNISLISKCIELFNTICLDNITSKNKAVLYYNIANAWNYKYRYEKDKNKDVWNFDQPNVEEQLFYLRSCINEPEFNTLPIYNQCLAYTNLANTLDTIGRYIDAIALWKKALDLDENFGMALGNIALGMEYYARDIYDNAHKCILIKGAYDYYSKAINNLDNMHQLNVQTFTSSSDRLLKTLKENCNIENINEVLDKKFNLGKTKQEKSYRLWCLQNTLFLNPINDLGEYSVCARDVISTPNIVTALDVGPIYQGFYNQMKQEYVSARYLLYEGLINQKPHFSDSEVLLYDTFDLPCYSLSIEKVKTAFRIAYGIFDKIAFFINEYFNLGVPQNKVYFQRIWFENGNKKNGVLLNINISENLPLRGLYWLSRDLYDDKAGFKNFVEPNAKNLHEIRNHVEHKYFKVLEYVNFDKNFAMPGLDDDLAYTIQRNDFEQKTLFLIKLVRNALIYLSLSIHVEEQKRENAREKGIVAPMFFDLVNHKYKK